MPFHDEDGSANAGRCSRYCGWKGGWAELAKVPVVKKETGRGAGRPRAAGGSRERTLYLLTIALGAGWLKNAQRKTGAMPGKIKQLRCRMKSMATPAMVCGSLLLVVLVVAGHSVAKDKKTRKSACSNAHPEQVCTAANICGWNGAPCVLEVKRVDGGTEASVTPNIANFPKDGTVCIKTGANVTWQGAGKNTGVMVDFGETSPFEPSGTIMGGSDRPVSVVAKKAGCFKYTVGACTPGSIYGMCGNSDLDLIVTSGGQ